MSRGGDATGGRKVRARARIVGTVQGVGFRPYVYRLASEHRLGGRVWNDAHGVIVEVEGSAARVEAFLTRLPVEVPPLAEIESISVEQTLPRGERSFAITVSEPGGVSDAAVSADVATCDDCLAELFDSANRRHRYPFINCTNCGPRFTITRAVPYDRPLTSMAGFELCPDCRREYDDPADRRFHAQPNACPVCGPRVRLVRADGDEAPLAGAIDSIHAAAQALGRGLIVAIKGLGGYHLACDAASGEAVGALRARKHRDARPFAVMVRDALAARLLVDLTPEEQVLLCSAARPIVLLRRQPGAAVAAGVAPVLRELGVMLPYSPLHHLLLADLAGVGVGPLVMTSGNVSDEPIAYDDADALERLAGIADLFLVHDRPIHIRSDDSVMRVVGPAGATARQTIRRSRGYVPHDLALPVPASRPLLACGAEQKSTFCVAKAERAWVGHHIGDLEQYATLRSFREGVAHFERLFSVAPALVAHDLHPDYLSTAYALELEGVELEGVQHHHAHLAACLAEHGLEGPVVAAIYDGTGYGTDGTVWGGELLVGGLREAERAGCLWPVRMPGGSQAIRQPWRMVCAWLGEARGDPSAQPASLLGRLDPERWRQVAAIARSDLVSPLTTSMGRLFDAVAVLCGAGTDASYEGQPAIELEAMAADDEPAAYELPLAAGPPGVILDARQTIRSVVGELHAGVDPRTVAARFQGAVAHATASGCISIAGARGLDTVVLSGGVFQNRRLLESTSERLRAVGLRVLTPRQLPPNDGGISYGQAAVAAARDAETWA